MGATVTSAACYVDAPLERKNEGMRNILISLLVIASTAWVGFELVSGTPGAQAVPPPASPVPCPPPYCPETPDGGYGGDGDDEVDE